MSVLEEKSASASSHGVDGRVPAECPFLQEVTFDSMTVAWTPVKANSGSSHPTYELQMQEQERNGHEKSEWRTLSSSLSTPVVKKKNLKPNYLYWFRVRPVESAEHTWSPSSGPWQIPDATTTVQLDAPTLVSADAESVTLKWGEAAGVELEGYKVRYRDDASCGRWTEISTLLQGTSLRKKNLVAGKSYYFAVQPQLKDGSAKPYVYSPSSLPVQVATVSPNVAKLFPPVLLDSKLNNCPLSVLFDKRLILLYFSAHWCPPCKQFTPLLAQFYEQALRAGKSIAVVFVSSDRAANEFQGYLASMPWHAIPFENDQHRGSLGQLFNVQGIPRLAVLSGKSGRIVENEFNRAVPLSNALVDEWVKTADSFDK